MSPSRASLLPKLRDHYAEFLDHVSLVHLRLLASPTCVGLRYGRRIAPHRAFLACRLHKNCACLAARAFGSVSAIFEVAYTIRRSIHKTAPASFQCPSRVQRCNTGREFQPVVHRLRLWGLTLGSASPCADCHGAGTLGFPVSGVFTQICAYSVRHPHFWSLQDNVCHGPFTATRTLPYPCSYEQGQASAGRLIPTILGASTLDE